MRYMAYRYCNYYHINMINLGNGYIFWLYDTSRSALIYIMTDTMSQSKTMVSNYYAHMCNCGNGSVRYSMIL